MPSHPQNGLLEHKFWLVYDLNLVGNVLGVVFPSSNDTNTDSHYLGRAFQWDHLSGYKATYCVIPLGTVSRSGVASFQTAPALYFWTEFFPNLSPPSKKKKGCPRSSWDKHSACITLSLGWLEGIIELLQHEGKWNGVTQGSVRVDTYRKSISGSYSDEEVRVPSQRSINCPSFHCHEAKKFLYRKRTEGI